MEHAASLLLCSPASSRRATCAVGVFTHLLWRFVALLAAGLLEVYVTLLVSPSAEMNAKSESISEPSMLYFVQYQRSTTCTNTRASLRQRR